MIRSLRGLVILMEALYWESAIEVGLTTPNGMEKKVGLTPPLNRDPTSKRGISFKCMVED